MRQKVYNDNGFQMHINQILGPATLPTPPYYLNVYIRIFSKFVKTDIWTCFKLFLNYTVCT